MNWTQDLLDKYRKMARDRWCSTATPFRLGYVVGLDRLSAPAPYAKEKALRNYRDGLLCGAKEREKRDAEIAARSEGAQGKG